MGSYAYLAPSTVAEAVAILADHSASMLIADDSVLPCSWAITGSTQMTKPPKRKPRRGGISHAKPPWWHRRARQ